LPQLPPHFIPRQEISDELKGRLLHPEAGEPRDRVITAVQGMGGIGKTTLATALAHDEEVHARFPDGVLWATLGQAPETISLLNSWIHSLGDHDYQITEIEVATRHARSLIYRKSILIIIDDVWDYNHIRPFLIGGQRCQIRCD
jgi:NB-ARC domain